MHGEREEGVGEGRAWVARRRNLPATLASSPKALMGKKLKEK